MEYAREFYDVMVKCGMQVPPFEAWAAHYSQNSALWPVGRDGAIIGGILFKGHTVHVAVAPEYRGRWITRAVRRAYDAWQHEADVFATIPQANKEAIELVRRLGWKHKGVERGHEIYVKEATTCHPS